MNDQQNPYDPYHPQPQIIGYDAYGQPVYQQQVPQQAQQPYDPYDPYAQQHHQPQQPQQEYPQPPQPQQYVYDPYARPDAQPAQQPYDPYAGQQQEYAYPSYDTGQQWAAPQPTAPPQAASAAAPVAAPAPPEAQSEPPSTAPVPGQRSAPEHEERAYRTEQFSFIEEPDEDSEDVIDWLKFTESRSERREEARRRGRNRVVALVVVLVLAAVGGVGYLWSAGLLPGSADPDQPRNTATGPQKRDTIVVHLHDTRGGGTATALLVDNTTTKQGTTVLLPNSVVVADDEGSATTLGKSVEADGSSGTREAIGNLLGARITGTWRLDTPYLENLVEYLGGIEIDTDTVVPARKKGAEPLVRKGTKQSLNGAAAVAYATYQAPGEAEAHRLQRFGQVMYGVLRKMPSDARSATTAVEYLVQILDPSLPEKDLGASLAKLAEHAKIGAHKTALLPVAADGTLTAGASDSVVKDILGGKVTAPEAGGVPKVSVKDGSGRNATEAARVVLINGGYAFVGGSTTGTEETSQVLYADDAQKATAAEVAKTLGLPPTAVRKGKPTGTAAVTVVLGQDYRIPGAS